MKPFLAFLLVAVAGASFAQSAIRIRIRHADPYMIMALLEGRRVKSPEVSKLVGLMGNQATPQGQANPLIKDGTFFVNPTDNSLWFVPKP